MKFTREERETHFWYDPIENKTYCNTNVKRHITKLIKAGWTITNRYLDGTILAGVDAECNGFPLTVRKYSSGVEECTNSDYLDEQVECLE